MDPIFGLEKSHKSTENESLLTTVYDLGQLSFVRSLLDSEKIPYELKERGAGGAMTVIAGYSFLGTDIYVPNEFLEDAQAILTPLDPEELESEEKDS